LPRALVNGKGGNIEIISHVNYFDRKLAGLQAHSQKKDSAAGRSGPAPQMTDAAIKMPPVAVQ
jgi:hypothetical protein